MKNDSVKETTIDNVIIVEDGGRCVLETNKILT
jgi:hypothetical protein